MSTVISFRHCYLRHVQAVLNNWKFEFEICFGFRDSYFEFFIAGIRYS
ncbi:hypothetical protein D1AOALGA4SA_7274 [Olavius algarvensis Delta 1 endosymbiont]|nr:hypothetical protein D1AOALGA4SA_7274 [Olavius algarvensis Delta 1 endosymbiont]